MNQDEFAEKILTDYGFFLEALWLDRGLDKVAPLSEIELDIGDFASHGPTRRGVLAHRGVGKTHLVTAALAVYRFRRDPNRRIIIPSKSLDAAKKTVKLIREWLRLVWFLQDLAPRPGQRDAATYLDIGPSKEDRQPSLTAIGIDGQLANNRAHSILFDDIETPQNTKTLTAREDLDQKVREFSNILYPDRPHADGGPIDPVEIVGVGTFHHEESVYLKMRDRGYAFRTWPLVYPTPDEIKRMVDCAPIVLKKLAAGAVQPGDPVYPRRFPVHEVNVRRAEGRRDFAMQQMLIADLAAGDQYPLRLSDIMVMSVDRLRAPIALAYGTRDHNGDTSVDDIPSVGFGNDHFRRPAFVDKTWAPFTGTKAFIDSSGRGKDKTGVAAVAHLNGYLFVKRVVGLPGGYSPEALNKIALFLRETDAREVWVEDNFGGGMFQELLTPFVRRHHIQPNADPNHPDGWACSLNGIHATGQKELRIIDTLEPVISTHRLVFDRSVAENTDLQHQLTRITRQRDALKHEDELDALAGAVKAWQDILRVDPARANAAHEHAMLEEEIRRFYEDAGLPGGPTAPRYYSRV